MVGRPSCGQYSRIRLSVRNSLQRGKKTLNLLVNVMDTHPVLWPSTSQRGRVALKSFPSSVDNMLIPSRPIPQMILAGRPTSSSSAQVDLVGRLSARFLKSRSRVYKSQYALLEPKLARYLQQRRPSVRPAIRCS